MAVFEVAYLLGKTREEILQLDYEEYQGWIEFFQRRPPEWRADNRAAILFSAFAGGKTKPEDLFDSLRVIRNESRATAKAKTITEKFFERFSNDFTEGNPYVQGSLRSVSS